ncbi:TPA: ead/Ea22-like family protein [Klebsiella pneumoniae subsp. pneumoniae]|uniref:ead/Ea22-like family protein n=2 Tax=Klebsiella pneumoniae TaxID=573 RepID=UPI0010339549|nr:ead/Ea22-like family protein [Klebsiella pneumoniae]HBQ6551669.1 ead/Ea22-like family protein [Klebsiella pneumoniae]HDT1933346.1 ead/Ea22-like family protein [Klebsiella pneumoniae subsp. pneumoniae]
MTDITELAQSLKAAAEKATPGCWEYYPGNTSIEYNVDSMDKDQGSIVYVDSGDFTQAQTDRNGEFIAMANPVNVLALVEALEKAQHRIAELEEAEQKLCSANVTLDARAELAERQLVELESRTVKLPDLRQIVSGDRYVWSDGVYNYSQDVKVALADAGIKVEAE